MNSNQLLKVGFCYFIICFTAPDKAFFWPQKHMPQKHMSWVLIRSASLQNICYGYSSEAPNQKNNMGIPPSYLELCCLEAMTDL